jgi:hypothetical protein
VLAVIASDLGVIASLILPACVVYDLKRVRSSDGQFAWRDLFSGTTLAEGVPIISAAADAIFSALSTILVKEIGDAFGSLLRTVLPQIATGG